MNMGLKCTQVKQTIVRLDKQNKCIREIAGTFGVATVCIKSRVWNILRKKEHTSELSNIKRYGCPRRTTVVDDRRILTMKKKNPFTTSSQEKNTLREVYHCQSLQSREDLTRANTEGSPQGANKARLDFAKKHLKKPDHFWKSILWMAEIKINLYQNDGEKKSMEKAWNSWLSKAYNIIWETWRSSVMAWACMAYSLPRFSQMQQSWLGGAS